MNITYFFNFQKLSNDTNQIKEILGVHKWQVDVGIHDIAGIFSWDLRQPSTLRLFQESESFLLSGELTQVFISID